jgi:hypothetical protein
MDGHGKPGFSRRASHISVFRVTRLDQRRIPHEEFRILARTAPSGADHLAAVFSMRVAKS